MAVNRSIQEILESIRNAIFGKDVRESIAEGIEKCYDDSQDNAKKSDIVNNIGTTESGKILDATQGKHLKEIIDYTQSSVNGLESSLGAYREKNYFNQKVLTNIYYNNVQCYSVNNNGVTINSGDYNAISSDDSMLVLDPDSYTISITNGTCRIQIFANGIQIAQVNPGSEVSFIISAKSNVYVKFLPSSYPTLIGNIQIEKGTEATSYVVFNNPVYYNDIVNKVRSTIIADRNGFLSLSRMSEKMVNQGTISSGVMRYTDATIASVGYHSTLSVVGGEQVYFNGYCYNATFPVVIVLLNGNVVCSCYHNEGPMYGNIVIPPNADTVVINGSNDQVCAAKISNSTPSTISLQKYIDNSGSNLYGKKIVWFGTSIPAGGYIGSNISRNYPSYIAKKYNCTIYNEAVGSSCAHCKEFDRVSQDNPYGFNSDYVLSSRCLSNTHSDMQWMIDHYNESFWTNKPSLTDQYKTEMMSFSYETKLDKYLTESTFPDLFIFDHGYNDYVSPTVDSYTNHEFEPYTLQGALNFLIRRIYNYNPEAKILFIGNYKYQTRNGLVVQAQEAVAQRWDLPIFNTWNYTGLSNEEVYCDFTWVNNGGSWSKQASSTHLETINNILLPDGIHPHSRPDDLIIHRMANAIGKWLSNNVTFDE